MEQPVYHPLLDCEECKKPTRHYFVSRETKTYQCLLDRIGVSKSERRRLANQEQFHLLIYKCVNCGAERGYGNEEIEGGHEIQHNSKDNQPRKEEEKEGTGSEA